MKALQVFAGPRAREQLRQHGLQAADVRVIPAAAGGPKGLVLLPLDRYLFGHWLAQSSQTVHLLGASIGAIPRTRNVRLNSRAPSVVSNRSRMTAREITTPAQAPSP